MSYVTVASVGEVTLTAVTLADADFARPDPAWASITAANSCPFCSREIFFAAEVVPLKNASQFALIWAAALESPEDADADDASADDDGAELVEAELLELLQAVTAEASRSLPVAAASVSAGRAETQSSLAAVGVCADTGRTRLRCGSGALLRRACLYGWPGGPAPHHENG
jgi:hypothetical protein